MDPILENITNLSGVMLYGAFVFVMIEAIKNWIPEEKKMTMLPVLSIVIGMVIVTIPMLFADNALIETVYRGGLIGASVTGLVAWRKNIARDAEKPPTP